MKLNRETILANKEEVLVIALTESTLSDFLKSEALLSSLKQFIARGSAKELQNLQDIVFSALRSSATPSSPVTPSPATVQQDPAIQHETVASPQFLALPSQIKFVAPTATQYFGQRLKPHRVGNLIKAIEGFKAAYHSITSEEVLEKSAGLVEESSTRLPRLVLGGISDLWLGTAGPFEGHVGSADVEDADVEDSDVEDSDVEDADVEDADVEDFEGVDVGEANVGGASVGHAEVEDVIQRIRCLFRGKWHTEKATAHNEFRQRLQSLFLAHDIDELMQLEHSLQRGIRNITVAYKIVAARLRTDHKIVRDRHYKSNCYRRLIRKGGSGSLLLLGPNVNTIWEQRLNDEEVDLLLEFRRLYLHDIEKKSRQLNCLFRAVFKKGLIAHGWSSSALKKSNTNLMRTLRAEKKMEISTLLKPSFAKRLREYDGNEHAPVQGLDDCLEQHDGQVIPSSKRQKQSNQLLPGYSQASFQLSIEEVRNNSTEIATTSVDFSRANNEALDLRAAPYLPKQSISGPILQLNSQSLGIPNVEARNVSFGGNMQDVPYNRNDVATTTVEIDINNPNVLDENEVSGEEEDDGVSNEDEALDAFNLNMNCEEWIEWALTSG